jgi:hypothetical protein
MTEQVLDSIAQIEKAAGVAISDVRFVEKHVVGKVAGRQGDIYLHMVADNHAHGDKVESRQLAIGNSVGSRHVIEGASVEIFQGTTLPKWVTDNRTPLGPCFKIKQRETNTHPEHAHYSLPDGTYQVTHQMDARTWGRVAD